MEPYEKFGNRNDRWDATEKIIGTYCEAKMVLSGAGPRCSVTRLGEQSRVIHAADRPNYGDAEE